jgi:hypothetical protein
MLVRRIELSSLNKELSVVDLRTIVEPEEGEDAKFISSAFKSDGLEQTAELVQCKKVESSRSVQLHAGMRPGDVWPMGDITYPDFKNWVVKVRHGQSVADILSANTEMFYTVLAFGEPENRVQKFVPKELRNATWLRWYSPLFSRAFPVNYKHSQDPAVNGFATPDVRCRIRLLVIDSPFELQSQCEALLRQYYEVSESRAPEVVRRLRLEIENCATASEQANRTLSHGEIETIIAAGRNKQGKWLESRLFLRRGDATPADPNHGEPPGEIDFERGYYAPRPEFDVAWEKLKVKGFTVVSGPAGGGKTTLARFLAFKFLKERPNGRAYYYAVRPGESLDDETKFLETQLYGDALFIIDDENFEVLQVGDLAQKFMDLWREQKARAWLVITSTITYSQARATAHARIRSVLNEAPSIHLKRISDSEISNIVETLKSRAGLDTLLSGRDLAPLSHSNIGLALILARCAREFTARVSAAKLFGSRPLGQILRDWILGQLSRPQDTEFFRIHIAPIFIIGSFGLPIPKGLNASVEPLFNAGFLEAHINESVTGQSFRPVNFQFALILRQQYRNLQFDTLSDYLSAYPEFLPIICERLNSSEQGRTLLHDLAQTHFKKIVQIINGEAELTNPIDLKGISRIFSSLYTSHRSLSRNLLHEIAAPNRQSNALFFSEFVRLDRVKDARQLRSFFETLDRVDRFPVRRLPYEKFEYRQVKVVLGLFESSMCPLDEIAACLHAIKRCSPPLAKWLYSSLCKSPTFTEKLEGTTKLPDGLSVWIRFCEELLPVDRKESRRYLNNYLQPDRIVEAVLQNNDLTSWARLLLRLRRLQPKFTSQISVKLFQDHFSELEKLLRNENNLEALTNSLYTLSRINRRVAVQIANRIADHLKTLLAKESNYRAIGSTLESVSRNLSVKFGRSLTPSVNRDALLSSFQQENYSLDLVGKTLYNLHGVSAELAGWLVENLDYATYLRRTPLLRFRHLVYLLRGFLVGAHRQQKAAMLDKFKEDPLWLDAFRLGWREAPNLSEHALCILLLLDVPIRSSDILMLIGIPNLNTLEEYLRAKFDREEDALHIANALYAAARMDFSIGLRALQGYVERTKTRSDKELAAGSSHGTRSDSRKRWRPNGFSNLAHLGYLLQIATAIEPNYSRQLVKLIDLEECIEYATEEPNLGRLVDFIVGLHKSSRKYSGQFVERTCSEEIWTRQWDENEEFENVVQYNRALAHISWAKGREYTKFLIENFKADIYDVLDVEANLMLITNWMRVIAKGDKDSATEYVTQLSQLVLSTADFDTRIRSTLEATEALIECNQKELAKQMASRAVAHASQLKTIGSIRDWVVLFHKSLRIGRELGFPEFPNILFAGIEEWYFSEILGFESHPVLAAYMFHLHKLIEAQGLNHLTRPIFQRLPDILNKARAVQSIEHKTLALILARASASEIKATAENGIWDQTWSIGLASLLFASVFPEEGRLFSGPPKIKRNENLALSDWHKLIHSNLNEHISNLEFGLTLYLASASDMPSDSLEQFHEAAAKRAENEIVGATRWLLQQKTGEVDLSHLHFYLWTYIKDTVLRPTYLSNEGNVEKTVDSTAFKEELVRKPLNILM